MADLGLVVHHQQDTARELAQETIAWADKGGYKVRLPLVDAEVAGRPDLGHTDEDFAEGLALAVSLGGDGTILRCVDLVSDDGVPVLGVNVGQLGYLTEAEPDELVAALDAFFAGQHHLEERMRLALELDAPSGSCSGTPHFGLNEAVLEKTPMGHTVRIAVSFDGEFFTTYAADGLIVATPTGSTAYSFSARGPIVAPTHRALLVTPVSPHMLFDRPLVLEPETKIRLEVCGHRPATLSVDGRNLGTLAGGDALVCTAAQRPARLVSFGGRNFHRILKSKFGLNDR